MRFVAILKDSFREAIDTKVFYVMMTVSCVLLLFVACLSFKAQPAAELPDMYTTLPLNASAADLKKFSGGFGMPVFGSSSTWVQDKVEPLGGAPDSPDSPLRFTLHRQFFKPAEAVKFRENRTANEDFIKERFATFGDWKILDVTRVELLPSANPSTVAFEVDTRPTPATRRVWPFEPSLFFGMVPLPVFNKVPLAQQLYLIEGTLVKDLGAWVAILVSIVITAFFIPNMLRKGSVDLLLVKPIHRTTLLIYKYIGGLTFIFLNTTFVVGGTWLILGWRSGIWAPGFLLTIFIITFFFAILYSVSTLFGVLTRSPIVAILLTCLVWFVFWAAGQLYLLPDALRQMEEMQQSQRAAAGQKKEEAEPKTKLSEGWWVSVVKGIHFVLPRYKDVDFLTTRLLARDLLGAKEVDPLQLQTAQFSWGESLTVNTAFIAFMLGLACLRFATKDY